MNTTQEDGGPAFPQTEVLMNSGFPDVKIREVTGGMSLRDWFAGMALQGVMANAHGLDAMEDDERAELLKQVGKLLYETADAMLAARKEQP